MDEPTLLDLYAAFALCGLLAGREYLTPEAAARDALQYAQEIIKLRDS